MQNPKFKTLYNHLMQSATDGKMDEVILTAKEIRMLVIKQKLKNRTESGSFPEEIKELLEELVII